jgi:hypothetical protein
MSIVNNLSREKQIEIIAALCEGVDQRAVTRLTGKRNTESTMDFLHDHCVAASFGQPEISTDGFHPYRMAIRDAVGDGASHGVIVKT